MMHCPSFVVGLAIVTNAAFAAPVSAPDPTLSKYIRKGLKYVEKVRSEHSQPHACMAQEDALVVAETFQSIIRGYTKEQALAALTEDFVDYSSAVSIIINKGGSGPKNITEPIFTSRDEFMEGHGKQQPIPFETLQVWHNCEGIVSMVWRTSRSGQGQPNESAAIPVTGIAVLETEPTELSTGIELERAQAGGYKYRIHTLWSEFNTAAWLVNNGVLNLPPNVPATPAPNATTSE